MCTRGWGYAPFYISSIRDHMVLKYEPGKPFLKSWQWLTSLNGSHDWHLIYRLDTNFGWYPQKRKNNVNNMHRVLELIGSGITEKVCGGGGKWLIHTYTREGCISQRICYLYYTFKTQSLKCKNLLNIEKTYRKKILKISHFEVVHWNTSFHCKILLNFQETFQGILLLLLKSYFYRLTFSENKFCY